MRMIKVLIAVMIVAIFIAVIGAMVIDESNETLERTKWVERYER